MKDIDFFLFICAMLFGILITALAFTFIPTVANEKLATEVCQVITNNTSMNGHLDLWNSRIICSPTDSYSPAYERIIIKGDMKHVG